MMVQRQGKSGRKAQYLLCDLQGLGIKDAEVQDGKYD
jgi:hypothetical protein